MLNRVQHDGGMSHGFEFSNENSDFGFTVEMRGVYLQRKFRTNVTNPFVFLTIGLVHKVML